MTDQVDAQVGQPLHAATRYRIVEQNWSGTSGQPMRCGGCRRRVRRWIMVEERGVRWVFCARHWDEALAAGATVVGR